MKVLSMEEVFINLLIQDQYEMMYTAALTYLQMFDTYGNFQWLHTFHFVFKSLEYALINFT